MAKFKPEERAEIRIGSWLMENGMEVFTNRRGVIADSLVCGIFNISGECREKPDMVFTDGREWYVVEIKSGIGGKTTRESDKIINYYLNCQQGKTHYFVDSVELFPKIFLVGSFYSPEGRIFDREQRKESRHSVQERRMFGCPDWEYYESHVFLRTIWDRWKPVKDEKYALGLLLSDKLNEGHGKPLIFIQEFNQSKKKWHPPHTSWILGNSWRQKI